MDRLINIIGGIIGHFLVGFVVTLGVVAALGLCRLIGGPVGQPLKIEVAR